MKTNIKNPCKRIPKGKYIFKEIKITHMSISTPDVDIYYVWIATK